MDPRVYEKREPRVGSPMLVVVAVAIIHFFSCVVTITQLSSRPKIFYGVRASPSQQASFGAWTLIGLAAIPNALCATLFRIAGIVNLYAGYLAVHCVLCFFLSVLSFINANPCDGLVPPFVKQDYGVTLVCVCMDALVAGIGLLLYGIWVRLLFVLRDIDRDMDETGDGHALVHHAAKKHKSYGTLSMPSNNPFRIG
jgi:hypothetical protein